MFYLLSYSKACDTLVLVIIVHSKHSTHNNCKFSIMKRNNEDFSTETPPNFVKIKPKFLFSSKSKQTQGFRFLDKIIAYCNGHFKVCFIMVEFIKNCSRILLPSALLIKFLTENLTEENAICTFTAIFNFFLMDLLICQENRRQWNSSRILVEILLIKAAGYAF